MFKLDFNDVDSCAFRWATPFSAAFQLSVFAMVVIQAVLMGWFHEFVGFIQIMLVEVARFIPLYCYLYFAPHLSIPAYISFFTYHSFSIV